MKKLSFHLVALTLILGISFGSCKKAVDDFSYLADGESEAVALMKRREDGSPRSGVVLLVHVKKSKTDQARKGATVMLAEAVCLCRVI